MFGIFHDLSQDLFGALNISIAVVGFDAVGKTTICNLFQSLVKSKTFSFEKISPTFGVNLTNLLINDVFVRLYDISGDIQFRDVALDYIEKVDGIIFVCNDSHDCDKQIAFLNTVLNVSSFKRPVLVLFTLNNDELMDDFINFKMEMFTHPLFPHKHVTINEICTFSPQILPILQDFITKIVKSV
eukprot:TRINITY_DN14899_c0_g1_i1.p1 TRINITY_DN14899_c0_g1~~TRINITY_DN14899_c0_g1_i1.p1  ORF type:complete len:185 (+),score=54.61 TRINITY_DN14899_c0_g1_i1:31-585(+)